MWVLDEFDGVDIPTLHPLNFAPVGSPRVRDYLTAAMGGDYVDRYQNIDGSFEDVPFGRRTMEVKTLAKEEMGEHMFTRWNNLRMKSGTYGKLYRRWAALNAYDNTAAIVESPIYNRQWVWARMVERPKTKYGTFVWDGENYDGSFGGYTGKTPLTDYSVGDQPMEFVFETTDPYWRAQNLTTVTTSATTSASNTAAFPLGELPIVDAVLTIENTAATAVKIAIKGLVDSSPVTDYTAWTLSSLSSGVDYVVNSYTDEVYRDDLGANFYQNLTFNNTITIAHLHRKAPLIYIPSTSCHLYAQTTGGNATLVFRYYVSFKE